MNTAQPAWLYDEFQQVGVDFTDVAQVAAFDCNQRSSSVEAEQRLVTQLGIAAGHVVVDLGCGTGTFVIQAALAGASVQAVDVSLAMLTYAQQKAAQANVPQLQFHHAGFLTYEHPPNSADFVVTKFALHHLPDFWKMVALLRIAAMLKPGGLLYLKDVIFSFEPREYAARIEAWIRRMAKPSSEGFTAAEFTAHIREERSTYAWIIEEMLQRAGFEIVEADRFAPEYATYLCKKRSAKGDD
ncbi:methyltransferase domain-containing protein [Phormidium tenue FACHB-886]|nr:methyltransferase domain-containing protein [Phormidium tenue FACHB-886]